MSVVFLIAEDGTPSRSKVSRIGRLPQDSKTHRSEKKTIVAIVDLHNLHNTSFLSKKTYILYSKNLVGNTISAKSSNNLALSRPMRTESNFLAFPGATWCDSIMFDTRPLFSHNSWIEHPQVTQSASPNGWHMLSQKSCESL